MTRPPNATQRQQLAEILQALAEELTRTQAGDTMRLIGEAADNRYPSRSSTVPAQPHNRVDNDGEPIPPDTPVEAKALTGDRQAIEAQRLLDDLRALTGQTGSVLRRLWAWRPDRDLKKCPRCDHPMQRGFTRCQQIIDGVQCAASERNLKQCIVCERELAPGERLAAGRCDTHYRFWKRNGRDNITVDRLKLDASVVLTDAGTGHG